MPCYIGVIIISKYLKHKQSVMTSEMLTMKLCILEILYLLVVCQRCLTSIIVHFIRLLLYNTSAVIVQDK